MQGSVEEDVCQTKQHTMEGGKKEGKLEHELIGSEQQGPEATLSLRMSLFHTQTNPRI